MLGWHITQQQTKIDNNAKIYSNLIGYPDALFAILNDLLVISGTAETNILLKKLTRKIIYCIEQFLLLKMLTTVEMLHSQKPKLFYVEFN
jgi:hypothetical protein